jgi:hypothetical protein
MSSGGCMKRDNRQNDPLTHISPTSNIIMVVCTNKRIYASFMLCFVQETDAAAESSVRKSGGTEVPVGGESCP